MACGAWPGGEVLRLDEDAHQSMPKNLDWPVPSRSRMQDGQMVLSLSPRFR